VTCASDVRQPLKLKPRRMASRWRAATRVKQHAHFGNIDYRR